IGRGAACDPVLTPHFDIGVGQCAASCIGDHAGDDQRQALPNDLCLSGELAVESIWGGILSRSGRVIEIPQAQKICFVAGEFAPHVFPDLPRAPRHFPDAYFVYQPMEILGPEAGSFAYDTRAEETPRIVPQRWEGVRTDVLDEPNAVEIKLT